MQKGKRNIRKTQEENKQGTSRIESTSPSSAQTCGRNEGTLKEFLKVSDAAQSLAELKQKTENKVKFFFIYFTAICCLVEYECVQKNIKETINRDDIHWKQMTWNKILVKSHTSAA